MCLLQFVAGHFVMQPLRFDFPVTTNSDYTEELSFQVRDTYLDITGHSFRADVRLSPNSSSVIASFLTVSSPDLEGFFLREPAKGTLDIRYKWETINQIYDDSYSDSLIGDSASFYYDLLVNLPSGDQEVWLFGYLNVSKGITHG